LHRQATNGGNIMPKFAIDVAYMENFEKEWGDVTLMLSERFGKVPDMEGILFLIGINQLGGPVRTFTKEQKQDLMHIAVCHLLSNEGYYVLEGTDEEGWPHYRAIKAMPETNLREQENMLKKAIIQYFR